MRVLIYGLNFAPELTGVGRYTADMADWLHEQGHEVRVVTAYPYYPAWRILEGDPAWRWSREVWRGIRVVRCPLWVPRDPTLRRRLILLALFALSSCVPAIWTAWRFRPNVIWTVEPSIMVAPAALAAARLCGATSWLHVQDIELGALTGLGMVRRPRLMHALRSIYGRILRAFDRLSTISKPMQRELGRLAGAGTDIEIIRNWVDTDRLRPLDGPNRYRQELGLDDDKVVALYSGNLGHKQGVDSLLTVARLLADEPRVHFLICGDGALRQQLEAESSGLSNVTMLPLQPEERLAELLCAADIHLLPQRAGTTAFAMPSKLGGMLASGCPVVMQADGGCESHELFSDAVCMVAPDDASQLAALVRVLAADEGLRRKLGRRARRKALEVLDRGAILGGQMARALAARSSRAPAVTPVSRAGVA